MLLIWILAGTIPPLLWAIVNHVDKYLLTKTKHDSSVNVLMVYSTGFSIIVLPLILLFSKADLFSDLNQVVIQIIGGLLLTFSIYFYLHALFKEEASIVIPLALLVPLWGYFFSYILLNETITLVQTISCVLIVFGALILSLEIEEEKKIKLKMNILVLMLLCTVFQAAQETLFKFVTVDNSFVVSLFWQHIGILLFGIILIVWKRDVLSEFFESIKVNGKKIFSLNVTSEGINAIAYAGVNYATLLAPITIIMSLNAYQPVFVFIIGILLTLFAPHLGTEKIKMKHLLHKGSAIATMIIGTLLLGV